MPVSTCVCFHSSCRHVKFNLTHLIIVIPWFSETVRKWLKYVFHWTDTYIEEKYVTIHLLYIAPAYRFTN